MTSAQGTIPAGYEHSAGSIAHRRVEDRQRGLLALLAALLVAAMGVTAFGIYSGLTTEQQAATQPTISEEAIEAYGARWAARGDVHANTISPEAAEAYAARWLALANQTPQVVSPAAEPLPPGAQPAPEFGLPAGAQQMRESQLPPGATGQVAEASTARANPTPQQIAGKALIGPSLAIQKTAEKYSPEAIEAQRARYEAAGQQHLESTNRAALESRAAEFSPEAIEQRHALYEIAGKQHLEKSQLAAFTSAGPGGIGL